MPTPSDKLRLPAHLDLRRKLSPSDRAEIRASNESGRALAKRFGVSRRLVSFIKDPAKLAANLEARDARGGWRLYHDRETHTKAVRKLRRRKLQHFAELIAPPTVGIKEQVVSPSEGKAQPGIEEKLTSIDENNLL